MNKRILEELAEQAGWMMGDDVEGFNTRLEKFAELVVRECAPFVGYPSSVAVKKMLKHFGVEWRIK